MLKKLEEIKAREEERQEKLAQQISKAREEGRLHEFLGTKLDGLPAELEPTDEELRQIEETIAS